MTKRELKGMGAKTTKAARVSSDIFTYAVFSRLLAAGRIQTASGRTKKVISVM
jgi:hypothetical protein